MFHIVDRGYFWTGNDWTNVIQFAGKYTFDEAITIMDKRFINKKPRPQIRRIIEFQKKKKTKEKKRMLFSSIKMYQKGGRYQCQIKHDDNTALSGWHSHAADAYKDAECRFVYKPGYVQPVPSSEYVTGCKDTSDTVM